jgi:hypothetical protein
LFEFAARHDTIEKLSDLKQIPAQRKAASRVEQPTFGRPRGSQTAVNGHRRRGYQTQSAATSG